MKQEIIGLRQAIGIQSTDFEISDADYKELLIFSNVGDDYDAFKQACDNVQCKYPEFAKFLKLAKQVDEDESTFSIPAAEYAKQREKERAEFLIKYGHGIRKRGSDGETPTPEQIRAARGNLSQPAAAALIYSTMRTWQDWEAGKARMHPGLWELFRLKIAQPR